MGRVAGKVAVISGAARGQGRSHARMLAAEGADIIAVDLCADIDTNEYPLARPEDLDETARLVEKEGQRAITAVADVRDRVALSAAIDAGVAELGRLDIVVANAGICPLTAGLPPQAFADAVDVDLIGVLNLVHTSLKHLRAGASIIVIGSNAAFMSSMNTSGIDGGPGGAGYAFAKLAAAHYVNDFALALARFSIRMNIAVMNVQSREDKGSVVTRKVRYRRKPIIESVGPKKSRPSTWRSSKSRRSTSTQGGSNSRTCRPSDGERDISRTGDDDHSATWAESASGSRVASSTHQPPILAAPLGGSPSGSSTAKRTSCSTRRPKCLSNFSRTTKD